MDRLLISDSHIGRCTFVKHRQLESLLIDESYDELILNGDIFEIVRRSIPYLHDQERYFLRLIASISREKTVHYIIGNHDLSAPVLFASISHKIKFHSNYTFHIGKKLAKVAHGHHWDWMEKYFSCIAHQVIKIKGAIERNSNVNFLKLDSWFIRNHLASVERKAIKEARSNNEDILFLGHTHKPKHEKFDDLDYWNSGDWILGADYIKIVDEEIELCHI
jgi:UDP-2,3-diacylglucosamine pyrophosphatase LpxH